MTERADGSQVVVERPPPGLARGRYAWPEWGVLALGAAIALTALAALWLTVRARRRARRPLARRSVP